LSRLTEIHYMAKSEIAKATFEIMCTFVKLLLWQQLRASLNVN